MIKTKHPLILASNSRARNEMLKNVGLEFQKIPADIDEAAIIKNTTATPKDLALKLAIEKALHISKQNPESYVIGSDQILEQGGEIFQKAATIDKAREKLKKLRGKTHTLISSVALAFNGEIIWDETDTATLTMHNFDNVFLEKYLKSAENDILSCVGC